MGPLARVLRGAGLASVTLLCGAVAHVTAGGYLPGVGWFVALGLLLTWVGARTLARPASTRRVVLLTMGGQTFVHVALTALAGHRGDGVTGPLMRAAPTPPVAIPADVWTRTDRVGSLADQLMVGRPAPSSPTLVAPEWALHVWADLQPAQLPMMLAHLAAAGLVGWWLARGEQAAWTVVALASRPLAGLLARAAALTLSSGPLARPVRRPRGVTLQRARPRRILLAVAAERRGPPAPALGA